MFHTPFIIIISSGQIEAVQGALYCFVIDFIERDMIILAVISTMSKREYAFGQEFQLELLHKHQEVNGVNGVRESIVLRR